MASIEGYRHDIRQYNDIKWRIWKIIESLDAATQDSSRLSSEVASDYKINGNPTKVVDRIDVLDRAMRDEIDYLRNRIIPALDDAIDDAEREIEWLEEEERRREEEEDDDD